MNGPQESTCNHKTFLLCSKKPKKTFTYEVKIDMKCSFQKQPPEEFYKTRWSEKFRKIHRKTTVVNNEDYIHD